MIDSTTTANKFLWGRKSRPAPGMGHGPSLAALFVVAIFASSAARAVDCNTNGVDDACEIDCGMSGGPCDVPGCGQAEDCNTNGIPDGCDAAAFNKALMLDGTDDYLNGGTHSSLDLSNGFTLEAWVQANSTAGVQRVVSKGGVNGYGFGQVNGKLTFVTYGILDYDTSAVHLTTGVWKHIAVVFDSANDAHFYVNGQFVQTVFGPSPASISPNPLNIGRTGPSHAQYWAGGLDEVRIWSVMRTAQQIDDFHAQRLTGGESGLVAYWRMDEGMGQMALDRSPNSLHAILGSTQDLAGDTSDPVWITSGSPLAGGDCNNNGMLDECDILSNESGDCNTNGTPDECEFGGDVDCNSNGTTDHCEPGGDDDCNGNDVPDLCDIAEGADDCNLNNTPDACEIASTVLADSVADFSGVQGQNGWYYGYYVSPYNSATFQLLPQFGLNSDFGVTSWYLQLGSGGYWTMLGESMVSPNGPSTCCGRQNVGHWTCRRWVSDRAGAVRLTGHIAKLAANGCGGCDGERGRIVVDGVEIWNQFVAQTDAVGISFDIVANVNVGSEIDFVVDPLGYDGQDLSSFTAVIRGGDCNDNGVLDECDIASSVSDDCNSNGIPDECESPADCNNNTIQDICEPGGSSDCDDDGLSDLCEIFAGAEDCNSNLVPDDCDLNTANSALNFADADDLVLVPRSPSLEPADNLTLECWIRPDSVGPGSCRIIRNSSGAGYLLSWRQGGFSRLQLRIDKNTGNVVVTDTVDTNTYFGSWIHVAAVYSASGNFARLYVNGVLKSSTTAAGPLLYSNADVGIGNSPIPVEGFDGLIDEVRIWNVARTTTQILADMNVSYAAPQPGLVGYWKLDEGTGQVTADASGLGNNGTLGGTNAVEPNDPAWAAAGSGPASPADCDANGTPDECDIAGSATDCNSNDILDGCEADCDGNGTPDECDIAGSAPDCNADQIPDSCNIADGTSSDVNTDGIPDECQSDVRVVPVVSIIDPSQTTAVRSSEPSSLSAVTRGGTYYVEIWASDIGTTNTGLTGVYVDVEFCSETSASLVEHGSIFTVFPSGAISTGQVDEFGGSALPSGGGIDPEWVRIGWIQMTAGLDTTDCSIRLEASMNGVAALNRGSINWAFVDLESVNLEILPPARTYDLDSTGFINVGDLSLFAGSWLQAVPPGAEAHDFDCDETIGVSDLSWFATGWLKNTTDPTILYPPCGGSSPLQRGEPLATDVDVRLAVLTSPSSGDVRINVPSSVSSINAGQQYHVEVWVSDVGDINTGVTSAYFDFDFHSAAFSVINVNHHGVFTLFPSGVVGSGVVDELGGSVLSAGNAAEPLWTRVATVRLFANSAPPLVIFKLRESSTGVASYGRGAIPWPTVTLEERSIGVAGLGDVNADGYVDFQDVNPFTSALLGIDTDPGHQARSNVNQDGSLDGRDVADFLELLLSP